MIETLLLSVLIIAICMALLLVKLLFKKNGEFTSQHIHDSQAMKDRNIHCVIDQDREARQKGKAYWGNWQLAIDNSLAIVFFKEQINKQ